MAQQLETPATETGLDAEKVLADLTKAWGLDPGEFIVRRP